MLLNDATDVFIGNERVKRLYLGEDNVWTKHKFRSIKEMIDWGFIKYVDSYNSNRIGVNFILPKQNFIGFSVNPLFGDWLAYHLKLARAEGKSFFECNVTELKLIPTKKTGNLTFIQKRINDRYYVFFVDADKHEFVKMPTVFNVMFTLGGVAVQGNFKTVEEYKLLGGFGGPISFHILTIYDEKSQEFLKEFKEGYYEDQL